MEYLWSDAWLLQSIVLASGNRPATLAQVIGAADAVNHALLTDDELHGGLVRLTTGGFVVEIGSRFAVTGLVPATTAAEIRTSGWQRGRRIASEVLQAEEVDAREERSRFSQCGSVRESNAGADSRGRARVSSPSSDRSEEPSLLT